MTRKTTPAPDFRRTWLVQRLHKPRGGTSVFGKDNPFSFGGGLLNGGLSPQAMDVLRPIFSFDYMGSAEFEFGAVPTAFDALAKSADSLTAGSVTILLRDVAAGWRETKTPTDDAEAVVFYLCRDGHESQVRKRIIELAAKDYTLKEATRLPSTLRPSSEYDGDAVGWLELDNSFMFFTDEDMWAQTCAVFGVSVEVSA